MQNAFSLVDQDIVHDTLQHFFPLSLLQYYNLKRKEEKLKLKILFKDLWVLFFGSPCKYLLS